MLKKIMAKKRKAPTRITLRISTIALALAALTTPTSLIHTIATPTTATPIIVANNSPYTAQIAILYKAPAGNFFAPTPQADIDIIIGPGQTWTGGKAAPIRQMYGQLRNPQGADFNPQTKTRYSILQPISPDALYESLFEIRVQTAPIYAAPATYKITQLSALKKAVAPRTALEAAVQAATRSLK